MFKPSDKRFIAILLALMFADVAVWILAWTSHV